MAERTTSGRLERIRRIRRRVVAASLATFAIAWGVIAGTGSQGASAKHAGATAASAVASSSSTYDGGYVAPSSSQAPLTTRAS